MVLIEPEALPLFRMNCYYSELAKPLFLHSIAGNQGEDDVYASLKALRQSVVADLDARGSGLAAIATFNFNATLPALTLANRLYRDATRSEELVAQAAPVHPAFVSTTFKALSQ